MKDGFQLRYLLGGASRYPPISITMALYGTIKVGMEATVPGEAPVGGRYSAKVEVIDARSGTFGMRLLLANPDHKIPAGLRCGFPGAP